MTSVARLQIDRGASARLTHTFADAASDTEYEDPDGNRTALQSAWWRDEVEEQREDARGNLNDVIVTELVFTTASLSTFDTTGSFYKGSEAWDVDTSEGRGVTQTPTFTLVHLKRRVPVTRSSANKRFR